MASAPVEEPLQILQYQIWVLKVPVHCQGCQRKVKKVLHSIEGVYTVTIDSQQHKVTVTGNIDAQTLIRKLVKTGKHAEMWPEKPDGKEKKSGKSKSNEKEKESKSNENSDEEEEESPAENMEAKHSPVKNSANGGQVVRFVGVDGIAGDQKEIKIDGKATGEKSPVSNQTNNTNSGGGSGGGGGGGGQGKKKKKKSKKGKGNSNSNPTSASAVVPSSTEGLEAPKMSPNQVIDQNNLSPSNQHMFHYPPSYAPYQAYVVSYNATHPSTNTAPIWYMSPSPDMYAYSQPEQSTPPAALSTFEILSDENPNGCYIM